MPWKNSVARPGSHGLEWGTDMAGTIIHTNFARTLRQPTMDAWKDHFEKYDMGRSHYGVHDMIQWLKDKAYDFLWWLSGFGSNQGW